MIAPPVLTLHLFVAGQLRSRLNGSGSRAHWSRISRDARAWHELTHVAWLMAGKPTWDGPAVVTFTAYVGRLWDTDNLPASIKNIRDAAVKLILGTDDGPRCGHVFFYNQEVRPMGERGVLVTVVPLERRGA